MCERYCVEASLGQNRLASVYQALDERLQRKVLVHLLRKDLLDNPTLRQRFLAESQASARRSHPALLEAYDRGEVNERPFLVTEFVDGRALRQLVPLLPEEALLYLRQITGAIQVCQELGLPHPPISSSNMILSEPGRVRFVENWQLSPEVVLVDLAHYRPPERAQGAPPSPSGTVYALGTLLVELLSGSRPFTGTTVQDIARAQREHRLPSLGALRPAICAPTLEALIEKATATLPEQRHVHAGELGQALDALREQLHASTQPLSLSPRRRTTPAASRLPATAPAPRQPHARPARPPQPYAGSPRPQPWRGAVSVWLVLTLMLVAVVGSGWWLAEQISGWIEGGRAPEIGLPSLPATTWRDEARERLPEWLRWMVPEPRRMLIVNANGLNLRPEPGTGNTPLAELPNGTRVVLLEGPVMLDDGSQWARVRAEPAGLDGWVNLAFLKSE